MEIERLDQEGYIVELIYQPVFDDSKPKSQQYKLIIKKENKIFIERYGFTRSGAITFLKRWLNSNTK